MQTQSDWYFLVRVLGSSRRHFCLTLQSVLGFVSETIAVGRWRVSSERGSAALVDVAWPLLAARVEEQILVPGRSAVSPRNNELIATPALLLEGDAPLPLEVITIITAATGRLN